MKNIMYECVGWYGTIAILCAYFLLSFNFVTADSFIFQGLNATGALGIVIFGVRKKVYQLVVLNIVWCLIALGALLHTLI